AMTTAGDLDDECAYARLIGAAPSTMRRRKALHEFRLAPLHFVRRQIFLVGGDRPPVAVRVFHGTTPVAPELILHFAHTIAVHLGSRGDGAIVQRIAVGDVEPQRRGGAADRFGTLATSHRVVHKHMRVADLEVGVHDLAVRTDGARYLLRTQRLLVPVDGLGGVVERELRGDGV